MVKEKKKSAVNKEKATAVGITAKIDPMAIVKGYEYCPNCKAFTMTPVEGKGDRIQCMTCGYWTRKQEIDHREKFGEMRKLTKKQ
jgi:Zn ribbon nucleic-acid-binding protein